MIKNHAPENFQVSKYSIHWILTMANPWPILATQHCFLVAG